MPTAQISWSEWHLVDHTAIDTCAEAIYQMSPSFRSSVQRMRDDHNNEIRCLMITNPYPDDTGYPQARIDDWVVVIGGNLQVMASDQYNAWRGAL